MSKPYDRRWNKARRQWLRDHPLCVDCERMGRLTGATVVDHIQPHRGDQRLFWDWQGNWQSLCAEHHNSKSARERYGLDPKGVGADGLPLGAAGEEWR